MKSQLLSKITERLIRVFLLTILIFTGLNQVSYSQSVPTNTENYILDRSVAYPETNENNIPGMSVNRKSETIGYHNGFGKLSQNVNYRFIFNGTNYKDLVTYVEYDELGLNSISYLPYTNLASGSFRTDAKTGQSTFYNSPPTGVEQSTYPFAVSIYEKSPLLRTTQQGFVGSTWQPDEQSPLSAHTIRTYYESNSANEVLKISVDEGTNVNIDIGGYYAVGKLHKIKTTDENLVDSYVYTDMNDNEILKVTMDGSTPIKTYYVYDNLNRLRFVIPPEASTQLLSDQSLPYDHPLRVSWITEYKYDGLNREIEKIMPEEEPVWTVYDPAGRVVLRQDGIMRANNDWLFTKYDRKGRVIMTGIWNQMSYWENRDEAQLFINTNVGVGKTYSFYEEHTVQDAIGYTNNAFPPNGGGCIIYSINYYDDYDFDNNGTDDIAFQNIGFSSTDFDDPILYPNYKISGHTPFYRITDKLTRNEVLLFGAKGESRVFEGNHDYNYNPPSPETIYYHGTVRLLPGFRTYPDQKVYIGPNVVVPPATSDGDGEYLAATYFYDKYGRVIQTQSTNHIGGTDVSSTQYQFAGKVIRTKLTHTTGYKTVTVSDRFTYDHTGRLIDSYKKIDNGTELLVSKNEYNELGQLTTKKLGLTSLPSFLQTVDYRYNIRGWLKSVNDPYALSSDVFAFKLYYNDAPEYEVPYSAKYNGNITSMVWADNSNPNAQNAYSYYYDNLNRLNNANYGTVNGHIYDESNNYREFGIDYDKNGNIQHIKRNNGINGQLIDDLSYTYNGNKLKAVEDNPVDNTRAYDFKNGSTLTTEYEYDPNGNMIQDKNKGINITYNYLNLPVTISWNANNVNDKRKIEWLYDATGSKLRKTVYNTDGEATMVTDYVNGFVYNTNYGDALPQLSFFPMSEGRVVSLGGTNYELQYWLKDHLGNTRVAFKNFDDQAQVIQKDFYYPFGLTVNLTTAGDENKFKYNGKELEDEHGLYWYHYGVRYYDPQLGRWHTMDPADQFHSPYLYVGNNPVLLTDPDGAQAIFLPDFFWSALTELTIASNDFNNWLTDYAGIEEMFTNIYYNESPTIQTAINLSSFDNLQTSHSVSMGHENMGIFHAGINTNFNELYVNFGIDLNLAPPMPDNWNYSYSFNMEKQPSSIFTKTFSGGYVIGSGNTYNIEDLWDLNPFYWNNDRWSSSNAIISNSIWIGVSYDINLRFRFPGIMK